jgi:ribosomal protein S18 acetylase RimI-like enzyme
MQTSPAKTRVLGTPASWAADFSIGTATTEDASHCLDTLTAAFESDPVCRWFWPDRAQYRSAFPSFALAFAGAAFSLGSAHYYAGFAGVALWLPPGGSPDDGAIDRIMNETLQSEQLAAASSFFDQMVAYHPHEPHWHLPLIGVLPSWQSRGVGSALQRKVLQHCDDEGLTAYLEATNAKNIALYQRLGFEALGTIRVSDCPPLTPMFRKPRRRGD